MSAGFSIRVRTGFILIVMIVVFAGLAWSQTFQTLHAFNGSDGSESGPLVWDGANHIFGASFSGGHCSIQTGCGTVYEMTATSSGWRFTPLYHFAGGADGKNPIGSLVLDSQRNIYGVTPEGGAFNKGTVFELSPSKGGTWTKTTLYLSLIHI